jgi:hypothetical protein
MFRLRFFPFMQQLSGFTGKRRNKVQSSLFFILVSPHYIIFYVMHLTKLDAGLIISGFQKTGAELHVFRAGISAFQD